MKYATYDADGVITAFYDPAIHGDAIPAGAVELTDAEWQDCIDNPGRRRIDPATGKPVPYDPPPPPIEQVRAEAHDAIDQAAGRARARYITVAPGQEAVYIVKERQAREYAAAGYPADAVPPLVQADADALGITPQEAADAIIAKADTWIALAAQIERIRRGGKAAVDQAADAAAVTAARDQAVADLDAV